jgi:hypothetical protein
MKSHLTLWTVGIAAGFLLPAAVRAEDPVTNRFNVSMRWGLNMSAKLSAAPIAVPPPSRTTSHGDPYNYNNGYILPDISGSGDGRTWYWGNDNANQYDAAANTISLSRNTGPANLNTAEMKSENSPGVELAFSHELGSRDRFRFGYEAAVNYCNIRFKNNQSSYSLHAPGVTDAYPTIPGIAPDPNPHAGTFEGPGYVIGTTPVSSTPSDNVVGTVSGDQSIESHFVGGRLGFYTEYNVTDWLSLGLSAGLAAGGAHTSASWDDTVNFNDGTAVVSSGKGSYSEFLGGFYGAANVFWRLTDHTSATGGVQYQNLGTSSRTVDSRTIELNLSRSVFINVGLSFNF